MTYTRDLEIKLFGQLQIFFDAQTVTGLQTDRYQSLVAYFVLLAQTPQLRSPTSVNDSRLERFK